MNSGTRDGKRTKTKGNRNKSMNRNKNIIIRYLGVFLFVLIPMYIFGQEVKTIVTSQDVSVEWEDGKPTGNITALNGSVSGVRITKGRGKVKANRFEFTSNGPSRITISIDSAKIQWGAEPTIISVHTAKSPFSFLLRDVSTAFPIYISDYSVVVLKTADNRSFSEVQSHIQSLNLQTKLQKIESEPEESFSTAAKRSLNIPAPSWLGISRDFRFFEISCNTPLKPMSNSMVIKPKLHAQPLVIAGVSENAVSYSFVVGRGTGVEIIAERRLEEGVLPILNYTSIDDDIEYKTTSFVALENSPLTEENLDGTHYLVAERFSLGMRLTKESEVAAKPFLEEAFNTVEETVLYIRTNITNKGSVPRYAWLKTIKAEVDSWKTKYSFESQTGHSKYPNGMVFGISKINENPLPMEEMAVLLQPGEHLSFDIFIPHSPVSAERANAISRQSFDLKLSESKNFWKSKLNTAARISLPDKRIEEMIKAGLLHLDMITYGKEPAGTLAPTVGVYGPIGTESSPIIQFYNSMAWPEVAKRSIRYFFDKQHEDGRMQNYGQYAIETGAVLWSLGEYLRYTNDIAWIEELKPKVLIACEYLIQWREKNKIDKLKGSGYGMVDGRVADPVDNYRQFMLNGYAYLGLSRASEMLARIDPSSSLRIGKEAEAWRNDIRETFFNKMALSPVVPLGNGTWCPTAPPWPEMTGPRALLIKDEIYFSHGTFTVPDVLLGPMHLVFCEVLDPKEPATRMMLDYHSELFYKNNAVFSQPYYSRHNWVQAKLGLVKPFLKTYFNTVSAGADRETYTFWEHLYANSPHKTHEEAWFLMETRWMLYMEEGSTLSLFSNIPRVWMEDNNTIELNNVQSYFGPLNISVRSGIKEGFIEATIQCVSDRKPGQIRIRLPHPEGSKATHVSNGLYDPETETVYLNSFSGKEIVRIEY